MASEAFPSHDAKKSALDWSKEFRRQTQFISYGCTTHNHSGFQVDSSDDGSVQCSHFKRVGLHCITSTLLLPHGSGHSSTAMRRDLGVSMNYHVN
nr:hypothetical protein CFP56_66133 [Quercus suber]